jgi:hypothetical protein
MLDGSRKLQRLCSFGPIAESWDNEMVTALLAGVKVLFTGLCDDGTLRAVPPLTLAGSATVAALHLLRKSMGPSVASLKPATREVLKAALPAIERRQSNEESAGRMVRLIEYFVCELCEKAWGISDPWGDHIVLGESFSPLRSLVEAGNVALASIALRKARTADVGGAVCRAYVMGRREVFDLLIEDERCPDSSGAPLPTLILALAPPDNGDVSAMRGEQLLMIEKFIQRWPQTGREHWSFGAVWKGPLDLAVSRRDVQLTKMILDLVPGSICYVKKLEIAEGKREATVPTLVHALQSPCADIMRMLIDAGILATERYDATALALISAHRGRFVACGFPLKPKYEEQYKVTTAHREDINEVMDLLLAAAFPAVATENNPFPFALFDRVDCIMEEEHAISYLLKCKAAGMDIIHLRAEGVGTSDSCTLVHLAAMVGYNKLLDLAIQLQGPGSVDSCYVRKEGESEEVSRLTPLTTALYNTKLDTALHLLRHHKAKAAYRGGVFEVLEQPLILAIGLADDAVALPVVKELIQQDSSLCDLECYRGETVETTPVLFCCQLNLPHCLEALLSADLPGVQEMCTLHGSFPDEAVQERVKFVTPAQVVAAQARWDMLALLLRYCPDISVIAPGRKVGHDGTLLQYLPSVEEWVKGRGAPRHILVQVEAMAQKQRAEEKKQKVIAANSAIPSNAFEVPGSRVLTETEEKKKAKKKEAKKKAKERKRAAAAAAKEGHAGAGKEAECRDSSSDDSSGTDEEEAGMTEEERMFARAPTFDLEKERAARKARAEEEARTKGEEKDKQKK